MQDPNDHSSIMLLRDGLSKLGYRYEAFTLGGQAFTRFYTPEGITWLTADEAVHYPFLNYTARIIGKFKHLSNELADSLNITIPKTFTLHAWNYENADYKNMLQYAPLVVKPNDSSLARGVSLNVMTEEQLKTGIAEAAQFSDTVLCQQQISGEEVRIAVVDGQARAALHRKSPSVIGDGTSTVAELIEQENQSRKDIPVLYDNYRMITPETVPLEHVDMKRVLPAGEELVLFKTAMLRYGASLYNITDTMHPSYLRTAEKMANAIGNGFIAVDMLISDYAAPQTDTNYAFIEINMSPIIDLFYSCRDGNQYPMVDDLVQLIDKNLRVRK